MTEEHTSDTAFLAIAPPARGRRVLRFLRDNAAFLLALVLAIAFWEAYVRWKEVPVWILPAPSVIFERMLVKQDLLLMHAGWTLYETLVGFLIGSVIGVLLAVAIVYSRLAEKILFTFLVSTQAVPKIALAPLLIILLGFGQLPKIVIAVMICFFPVVVSTIVGLRSMPVETFHLARTLGASGWETFWKFRLPYALPSIFAGLKVAITLAVIGAVVGEYAGGTKGLGYYQLIAASQLDMRTIFAIIFYLSVMGLILFYIVSGFEKWVIRWDPRRQVERAKQR
ncbi:MAG: ABC transporter permease [Chloroflexi bacterium]|nr:ABC transporter permease [Chloroflexota bacterium]